MPPSQLSGGALMIDVELLAGPDRLLRVQHAAAVDWCAERRVVRAYRAALQGDPCCFCGGRRPRSTIDHIVPRSKGGTDEPGNWTAACEACNLAKDSWSLLAHLLHRAGPP